MARQRLTGAALVASIARMQARRAELDREHNGLAARHRRATMKAWREAREAAGFPYVPAHKRDAAYYARCEMEHVARWRANQARGAN